MKIHLTVRLLFPAAILSFIVEMETVCQVENHALHLKRVQPTSQSDVRIFHVRAHYPNALRPQAVQEAILVVMTQAVKKIEISAQRGLGLEVVIVLDKLLPHVLTGVVLLLRSSVQMTQRTVRSTLLKNVQMVAVSPAILTTAITTKHRLLTAL